MQYRHHPHTFLAATVSLILFFSTSMHALAAIDPGDEPLVLREIMQKLFFNMRVIKHGISIEDWELVAEAAQLITDHPQPPLAEKLRILSFAGSDVGKLKDYDKKTQQAAQKLRRAAVEQAGTAAFSAYTILEDSCLACHKSFRKAFKEHFYVQ